MPDEQDAEQIPEGMTVIAQEIVKLSEGLQAAIGTGLSRRLVVMLLADQTKLSQKTVGAVVDAMLNMKKVWTNIK